MQQKSKEQKAAAAMAGGKSRKKKWSKNKARDKILNEVLFKEPTYERLINEVPKVRHCGHGYHMVLLCSQQHTMCKQQLVLHLCEVV